MAKFRIMIVAGEASGDMHGAQLVKALRQLEPDLDICGMGGEGLAAQGVEMLYDASRLAVVGIFEVVSHLYDIRRALKTLEQRLRNQPVDLLILIDYPDFNFILAKKAKRLGIPILYYISPQVWAWRAGRVKTIGKLVDRMAVILPFEKDFYQERGVKVDFVGHPSIETVKTNTSRAEFLARHGINNPDVQVVGILPGSRKKEVGTMLPIFLETAQMLARENSELVFFLPLAPSLSVADLESNGLANCNLDIKVISGERYDLMAACDVALAASGTVTLELAILNVPMLVSYRVSPITYLLGRRLIKVKHVSLVNLVAGKEVVPELLQQDAVPKKLHKALEELLNNRDAREKMLAHLAQVRNKLDKPGASKRVAQLALEMIH